MTVDGSPAFALTPRVRPAPVRTVGVEEELLLVDTETLAPTPVADTILKQDGVGAAGFALEFEVKTEQLEVVGSPVRTLADLERAVVDGRRAADAAARRGGARIAALGTSPTIADTHLVASPRYLRMQERFGLTLREQLTCGFHVHVAISSPEEGVAVLDRLRPWLPVLLALSANSPFWRGADTAFASYRYQVSGRWPTAGPYDLFSSVAGYEAAADELLGADVPLDRGMLYYDARLSHHVPTVEVRVMDVLTDPLDAVALAGLVRALVEVSAAEWKAGEPAPAASTALLRAASWRASRFGLGAELVHPLTGRVAPAAAAVTALLHHVGSGHASVADRARVDGQVRRILRRGPGAERQRGVAEAEGDPSAVVADAIARTNAAG